MHLAGSGGTVLLARLLATPYGASTRALVTASPYDAREASSQSPLYFTAVHRSLIRTCYIAVALSSAFLGLATGLKVIIDIPAAQHRVRFLD